MVPCPVSHELIRLIPAEDRTQRFQIESGVRIRARQCIGSKVMSESDRRVESLIVIIAGHHLPSHFIGTPENLWFASPPEGTGVV